MAILLQIKEPQINGKPDETYLKWESSTYPFINPNPPRELYTIASRLVWSGSMSGKEPYKMAS